MISRLQLIQQIKLKKSFLCVGLDPDMEKIPTVFIREYPDPIFEFNKRIIDATHDLCIAYKPNSAFYEAQGIKGLESLAATWKYLPKDCLSIIVLQNAAILVTPQICTQKLFLTSKRQAWDLTR